MDKSMSLKSYEKSSLLTYAFSIILTTIIMLLFIYSSSDMLHPFIIPTYISGVIICFDLIDWMRGRMSVFDPIGFLGLFGYHFFFIAPLLQVYWARGMTYVIEPADWRTWLLGMGIINMIGLSIYRISYNYFGRRKKSKQNKTKKMELNTSKLVAITVPILVITFALQTYIYLSFGGISGYINTYSSGEGSFEGLGFLFLIAESFPIIFLILLIQIIHKKKWSKNYILLLIILAVYFVLKLYFGGLRGSRSNTLWGLIWAVGIIHLFIRPIGRKAIIVGSVFLLGFIYIYGLYKGAGEEIFNASSTAELGEITEETGRGIETVLLGDLSRTSTQAFILHKLVEHPDSYTLAKGRSYIGDVSILIPKRIYPNRQPTKVKEGTEIIRGKDTYNPNGYTSSRIYGLTGEFMLNFGYVFAPLVFILLGYFVSSVRSVLYSLKKGDSRFYLYPFLVIMCFLILVQDLDNLIFSITKNLLIPYFIIVLSSQKKERGSNYEVTVRS